MDIYIEATDETLNNYVETNFLSRWCGWKKPNTLVSYYNIIIFTYHSDNTNRGSHFSGTFEFIDAGKVLKFCSSILDLTLNSFNLLKNPITMGENL